jgi:hypothetical protein
MRFQITMNMPSRAGNPVHQIICDYDANSLAEFCDALYELGFLVVREVYKDGESGQYYQVGEVAVNARWVGKIKVFT